MLRTARQHAGLQQELQVHYAAGTLLQVQSCGIAAVQFGAHAAAHLQHVRIQHTRVALTPQRLCTHLLEVGQQAGITGHAACAHQGLVFPGPCAFALVFGVAGQRRHQRTLATVRAQAHVDVVQAPGSRDCTEQRHHLLRQACIPAARLQRARAITGIHAGRVVMQEYQVQIGTEAQFKPTEAAVADDRETSAGNPAVCGVHVRFGHRQHGDHHRLRQFGQLPGAVHRALAAIQRSHRHAEAERQPRFVEPAQRGFGIFHRQHLLALGQHAGGIRHRPGHAYVQQFVQQQRIRRQALGQQRAARQHIDQPRQRAGLFVQQREIAGPAQHRLQQAKHTLERGVGLWRARGRMQQCGQHAIQPRTRGIGQGLHAGALGEIAQRLVGAVGIEETGFSQQWCVAAFGQAAPVVGQRVGRGLALARRQQRGEFSTDPLLLFGQRRAQHVPVRIAEADGNAFAVQHVAGQYVGLRVAQHLQAVLQPAQEQVSLAQCGAILGRDLSGGNQCIQRHQQATLAQCRFTATADQLQCLAQEFDFADATGATLDVLVQLAARDLGGDRRLHFAQAIERGEIEVAAVHERAQGLQPRFTGGDVAGHRARLQPRIAFPVAALALEILVHRRERQRDAAGAAERAQTQVDAVAEAIDGGFVQQLGQALAETGEILFGGQRTRAIGFAAVRVGVDQVDIGTEVELATAQLAEAKHYQLLRDAFAIANHAVALGEFLLQGLQCQPQAVLGQGGGAGQGLRHVVQPGQVAPDQPCGHRRSPAPQLCRPITGLQRVKHRRRDRRAAGRGQLRQQGRLPHQGIQGEVAGHRQPGQQRQQVGRDGLWQDLGQARQGAVDKRLQGDGQISGGEGHGLIVSTRSGRNGPGSAGRWPATPVTFGSIIGSAGQRPALPSQRICRLAAGITNNGGRVFILGDRQ